MSPPSPRSSWWGRPPSPRPPPPRRASTTTSSPPCACSSASPAWLFGEPLARWLAPRPLASSVAVAWLVTVVRFLLEKSAAPAFLVQAIGVTWLAPVAGANLAIHLTHRPARGRPVLRALVCYAFLVRGFVALVGVVATRFGLGSHYDVSGVTFVPVALTGDAYSFVPGRLAADLLADPRAPAARSGRPSPSRRGWRERPSRAFCPLPRHRRHARPLARRNPPAARAAADPQGVWFDGVAGRVLP